MNVLASLLLLGLSTLPVNTVLEDEVVLLTSEDLARKRSPVFFAVHRVGNTGYSLDFALTQSAGMAADLGPYQLCVLNQPLNLADLPGQLSRVDQIVRTETVRQDRATFELRRDEIPNSVLIVYLVTRAQANARNVRAFCLPLAELLKTTRLAERRPLLGGDGSVPA